jgi:hypothetical protein
VVTEQQRTTNPEFRSNLLTKVEQLRAYSQFSYQLGRIELLAENAVLFTNSSSSSEFRPAHLDILREPRYAHPECLLKNTKNASNCSKAPWTC